MRTVTVASLNIGDGPDARKVDDLTTLATAGADVICLQEASDRQKVIGAWARRHGWRVWYGDGSGGAAACPILWRPGVPVTGMDTHTAVPARYVGNPGAGPSRVKRKVVNRIRIKRGRFRRLHVLNTHLIPSATRDLPNTVKRRRHYADHIKAVSDVVRRRWGAVVLVGDFNSSPSFALLAPLRAAGMRQHVRTPTHGRRTIDHAWTRRLRVCSVRTIPTSSDHRAVVVTVR